MAEKKSSVVFTYHDPGRTFDGTPYQAAAKSASQAANVLRLLEKALKDTNIQARNAWMQRQLDVTGEPNAKQYESSPEFKLITAALESSVSLKKRLAALEQAVGYDPAAPPKE